MNALSKIALAVVAAVMAAPAAAQVTFYEHDGFHGRSFTTERPVDNLERRGFNGSASSAVVRGNRGQRWEVCEDPRFRGRCAILRQGEYPSLATLGLGDGVLSVRAVSRDTRIDDDRHAPAPPPAQVSQVVFYEHEGFQGRTFTSESPVLDLRASGFNDRASSAVVRGQRWEACEDSRYGGRCVVLRPGQYASLHSMGLNDRISSVRAVRAEARVDDGRYSPAPVPVYDYGRRYNERLYQADITSVRAVLGTPAQRCWVEREQVVQPAQGREDPNVGGAVLGAVLGGILGHQVGGGSGRDVATAIGVLGGAAVGANVNRDNRGQQVATQDVQRCTSEAGRAQPDYWDVTYNFRGQDYRAQMTTAPGATMTVNAQGEPRV